MELCDLTGVRRCPKRSLLCQRPALTLLTTHASPLPCSQSLAEQTWSQRSSRSRRGPEGQLHAAITKVRRLWLEPTPECSPSCQHPLTRSLTVPILPLAWQSRGQQHQSRWRLCARCRPKGDDDHQPKVRRLRVFAFVMSAPIDTLASFSLSPLLPSPAAQKCLLPCQRPLTRLLSHYSLTIPTPPLARSLGDHEFADQAKQAIKDAAGTSGVFIAL